MTQKSLDTLSKAPVGSTVEVEGRRIRVAAAVDDDDCERCIFQTPDGPCHRVWCQPKERPDNAAVKFIEVPGEPAPWQDWPDAKRDGMCEIPVVIARNLRALLDEVTPRQWIDAGLTGNDQIEAVIYLDIAVNGGKVE